ncbi:EF-hand domain-containing protein [Cupriavidus agavae]|uniref:EF-hand domain-containing protein n=1 Tax=Cupriavidus agavae TaxID=1001822 RepID=A0A4Q7RT34_9BURK|nr:hypothetical protein [Cupriavidus agavae]RZT36826.1 hypothetical protein EV147_3490 [Cupriavidus agavae]
MNQLRFGIDAIFNAQAWSSSRQAQAAQTASANATAVGHFKERGLNLKVVDMVDGFKADKLKATDRNGDDVISLSELGKQLAGASEEELSRIHEALDLDKNGEVSGAEFKYSMPVDEYFDMIAKSAQAEN